jgi:hypothetical protein
VGRAMRQRLWDGLFPEYSLIWGLRDKGKLPLGSYLRSRVRHFCDGAVLGGKEFVEGEAEGRALLTHILAINMTGKDHK